MRGTIEVSEEGSSCNLFRSAHDGPRIAAAVRAEFGQIGREADVHPSLDASSIGLELLPEGDEVSSADDADDRGDSERDFRTAEFP